MTKRMKRKITAALLLTVLVFTAFREPLMKLAKEATFYWFDHTETELMVKAYAEENRLFYSDYPESLIALLERNPETKEFVLEYPQYRAEGYDLSQYEACETVPLFCSGISGGVMRPTAATASVLPAAGLPAWLWRAII